MLTTEEKMELVNNLNDYPKGISSSAWFSSEPSLEEIRRLLYPRIHPEHTVDNNFRSPDESSHDYAIEHG